MSFGRAIRQVYVSAGKEPMNNSRRPNINLVNIVFLFFQHTLEKVLDKKLKKPGFISDVFTKAKMVCFQVVPGLVTKQKDRKLWLLWLSQTTTNDLHYYLIFLTDKSLIFALLLYQCLITLSLCHVIPRYFNCCDFILRPFCPAVNNFDFYRLF